MAWGGGNTMITRFDGTTKVADVTSTQLTTTDVLDLIYPIGAIAIGAKPSIGTWERIQGRFLWASNTAHPAGSTGGEEKHKLTTNEMPSHNHTTQLGIGSYVTIDDNASARYGVATGSFVQMSWGPNSGKYTGKTGGGQAHNNMPPYLSVDMWRRTA